MPSVPQFFSRAAVALGLISVLVGCTAPKPMESAILAEAIRDHSMDDLAAEACETRATGPLAAIAAVDSSGAEIREIWKDVETRGTSDEEFVPDDPGHYIAICIFDVEGVEMGIVGDPHYLAMWFGGNGNGIITAW